MSGNQSNNIIGEAERLIDNVNIMIDLHTEVMKILMKYYSFYNYEHIMKFKKKASEKVKDALKMTQKVLDSIKSESEGKSEGEDEGEKKDEKGESDSEETSKKKDKTSKTTDETTSETKTGETIGGSGRSRRGRRGRVKKSTVQYEIDDILTGGYWKEMKKKK